MSTCSRPRTATWWFPFNSPPPRIHACPPSYTEICLVYEQVMAVNDAVQCCKPSVCGHDDCTLMSWPTKWDPVQRRWTHRGSKGGAREADLGGRTVASAWEQEHSLQRTHTSMHVYACHESCHRLSLCRTPSGHCTRDHSQSPPPWARWGGVTLLTRALTAHHVLAVDPADVLEQSRIWDALGVGAHSALESDLQPLLANIWSTFAVHDTTPPADPVTTPTKYRISCAPIVCVLRHNTPFRTLSLSSFLSRTVSTPRASRSAKTSRSIMCGRLVN